MELNKGYKHSDLGPIPKEWNTPFIPEVISKKDGIKIGPFGSQLKKELLTDNGYKVYGQENVYDKDMNIGERFINKLHFEKLKSCEISGGDFLISMMGTIGKTMIVPKDIEPGIMDSHLLRLRLNEKVISPELMLHHFSSSLLLNQVSKLSVGGIMDGLSSKIIKNIILPLPPTKAEQTAIATVLSDMDKLISRLEKLIKKKQAIKQGAMQQLLKPKKGWQPKKLIDIADKNIKWSFTGGPFGSNLKSSDYTDHGIRVIQLQNIGDGKFIHESEIYTSKQKADELISCNIYPGDIILSKMGDPVARACIIPDIHERYLMCSDGIRLAINKKDYDTYFIYTYINSPAFRLQAENNSTGSTRKRIGLVTLKNLELIVPKVDEQRDISELLLSMDSEIFVLKNILSKYKMLKQGMMQELLTGKTRLV